MNLLPGPVLYTILEREGKLRKKKKRRAVWTGQKTDSFISPRFCFIFFMTAGVLIVAAGSLLQHYFALRHPVFIPMHIELEMYWDGGMDGDTMGSMDGNADVDAGSAAGEDRYVWKEFPIYYIQDSEDTSKVAEITFPQLEGIGEYWMTPYDGAGGLFQSYSGSVQDGRYQFKQLFVKMMLPARSLGARGITLDTIKVRYGDGAEEEVSIGQNHPFLWISPWNMLRSQEDRPVPTEPP